MLAGRLVTIPDGHRDMLTAAVHWAPATMMPDGQPQRGVVWVDDDDGTYVHLNTTLDRRKGRNMSANPQVSLLVADPRDTSRWIAVQSRVVELRREGAEEHANVLTRSSLGQEHFDGDICRSSSGRGRHG